MDYQYNEEFSTEKNIAIALYAIANEFKKFVDNNTDQSYAHSKVLEKELKPISIGINKLTKTIRTYKSSESDYRDHEESANLEAVVSQLQTIAEKLGSICYVIECK